MSNLFFKRNSCFQKFIGHFRTVFLHRKTVRKLCFKCGLYKQGLLHDLTKYSFVEFWSGVKFYTGTKSPHVKEREVCGYSAAWLHHKGHNKHHPEYWQDIRPNGKTEPIEMLPRYFAEMVCDRVAASMIYLGDKYTDASPLEYYITHKDEVQMHPNTHASLEAWLTEVKDLGTDKAFNDLKKYIKDKEKNT